MHVILVLPGSFCIELGALVFRIHFQSQVWWNTPLTSELGRQSLVDLWVQDQYTEMGTRTVRALQRKLALKITREKKKIYLQSYCIHETFQICQMNKLLSHLLNFISHYTQYSIIQSKFIKGENSAILIFIVSSPKWKHRTKRIVTILNTYMFILCWVIFTGYVIMSVRHLTDP